MPTESDGAGRPVLEVPLEPLAGPSLTRGERIFRGMVGMGAVFGAIGFGVLGTMAVTMLLFFRDAIGDDMDLLLIAPFGWGLIAFGLGMLYGGLLALVGRGRSLRSLSAWRVAAAGAVIGLIPPAIVFVSDLLGGGSFRDVLEPLQIFPALSAIVATGTLLIARRAESRLSPSEPHEPSIEG